MDATYAVSKSHLTLTISLPSLRQLAEDHPEENLVIRSLPQLGEFLGRTLTDPETIEGLKELLEQQILHAYVGGLDFIYSPDELDEEE